MAIFYHPPPPFLGGRQSYAEKDLSPDVSAVAVDNPAGSTVPRIVIVPDDPLPQQQGKLPPSLLSVDVGLIASRNVALLAATLALWIPAAAQPSFGAGQPFAPKQLSPAIPGQSVDPPPPAGRDLATDVAITAAAWQPEAWPYRFAGGSQPYAPRVINPGVPGQSVDAPPSNYGGPVAVDAAIIAAAQPNPWTFVYFGSGQPFQPKVLSPAIPGQSVDQPPIALPAVAASLIAQTQPNSWVYAFFGAGQPFQPRALSPGIPGQSVDKPPTTLGGPVAMAAAIISIAQPNPWTYTYFGAGGPFVPRVLNPDYLNVVQGQDKPPITYGGPIAPTAAIIALAQPPIWTHAFVGGRQPFEPAKLAPSLTAVEVDEPPYTDAGRTAAAASVVAASQPDPWRYLYLGAAAPFAPRTLSPGLPGQSVDQPPFIHGGPVAKLQLLATTGQPEPWPFRFVGGAQPYGARILSSGIPGQSVDQPPSTLAAPTTLQIEAVALNQPEVWTYRFIGARQPYEPRTLSPGTPGQSVDQPPFDPRGIARRGAVVAATQPNPWTYRFLGGLGPFSPNTFYREPPPDDPPFNRRAASGRAAVITATQPEPWTYSFEGGAQPYGHIVPTPVPAPVVNDPPFDLRSGAVSNSVVLLNEIKWPHIYQGGWQAYAPRRLHASLLGITVDNPPFTLGGPLVSRQQLAAIWQPDPWTYRYAGGRGPFLSRKLPPSVIAVTVDNPPSSARRRQILATIIEATQPLPWWQSSRVPLRRGPFTASGPIPPEPPPPELIVGEPFLNAPIMVEGFVHQRTAAAVRTSMESGFDRVRLVDRNPLRTMTAIIEFTGGQAKYFNAWYEYTIKTGQFWFYMNLPIEVETRQVLSRFLTPPKHEPLTPDGGWWKITVQLEINDPNLITRDEGFAPADDGVFPADVLGKGSILADSFAHALAPSGDRTDQSVEGSANFRSRTLTPFRTVNVGWWLDGDQVAFFNEWLEYRARQEAGFFSIDVPIDGPDYRTVRARFAAPPSIAAVEYDLFRCTATLEVRDVNDYTPTEFAAIKVFLAELPLDDLLNMIYAVQDLTLNPFFAAWDELS